jgi:hypothetical protein
MLLNVQPASNLIEKNQFMLLNVAMNIARIVVIKKLKGNKANLNVFRLNVKVILLWMKYNYISTKK